MKLLTQVRVIEGIEVVILLIGYAATGVALGLPSYLHAYLKDLYMDISEKKGFMLATDRGESATPEEKDIYFSNSAEFTVKVITGILILTNVIMTTLFILLCLGIHKKRGGKLAIWLTTHTVAVVFFVLLIVGSVSGQPSFIVYQIPNCIYQGYRIMSLVSVYRFRNTLSRHRSPVGSDD